MKLGVCLLLLVGCGGAPFTAAGPDLLERDGAPDVATAEGGPQEDGGGGDGDALADGEGGQVDAPRDAPAESAPPVRCVGATPPMQFYERSVLDDGGVAACDVVETPADAGGYTCGPITSAWRCQSGTLVACRDATSTPPVAVVEVDCD